MNHLLHLMVLLATSLTWGLSCSAASPHRFVDAMEGQQWDLAGELFSADRDDVRPAEQTQPDGMTPLHWAVFHQSQEWTRRLLQAGADPNAKTLYDITPLAIACQRSAVEVAAELLRHHADANEQLPGKFTPLMMAARAGSAELCSMLIQYDADVDAAQRNGQTALMFASAEGHADVIETLLDAGADLHRSLPSGFTPLCFAARQGHAAAVTKLLDRGASVSETMQPKQTSGRNPRKGMSPLMLAVESAHYELAMELVRRGADPNEQTSGFTPLHALSWVRRPGKGDNPAGDPPPRGSGDLSALEFVREIVDAGADVNLKLRRGRAAKGLINPNGATPFLLASQTVDLPYMQLLLELGADPTIVNADGCSALMAAAGVGTDHVGEHEGTPEEVEQAIRLLVDSGLDINAVAKNDETAMHGAAYRCFPDTVRLLVQLGAKTENWNHKNKYGWTPLDIALGHRPGSFKPDPATIAAIEELLPE
ncbi:ankyrin repeat domain-containing protein [Allorhodopirellula heiligendammensis]|uniref:Ankyrin repeat protein n=1 Tax=Allorhodopirellula heiligendammensis TaxID=2714739 RepID=A0A5C6BZM3_9BACT|nr:ankyrin repeat domain-containing protein [Allorhodopirellula heiligendammensis]TWU16384.1 Ankyrin repeat protein [Allorhodopirellula heiligendammensis]